MITDLANSQLRVERIKKKKKSNLKHDPRRQRKYLTPQIYVPQVLRKQWKTRSTETGVRGRHRNGTRHGRDEVIGTAVKRASQVWPW